MKTTFAFILTILILILNQGIARAQDSGKLLPDWLAQKFEYYRLKKQQGILFAHFDKTVYTNNENVWFTAYLLNNESTAGNDVLSAILVRDDSRKIALSAKFVIKDGIAPGNVFLPDTIASGDYSFLLYTNDVVKGSPVNIFTQAITIKNTSPTSFKASLDLLDTAKVAIDGKRRVMLVTGIKDGKIISGATVTYYLGNKLHPLQEGKVKTDKSGQYLFTIPDKGIKPGENVLEACIKYGREEQYMKLILPVSRDVPLVSFYPEGGSLTDGLLSEVGWEAENAAGNPYKTVAVLYKDNKPIDTLATNSYGMGRFKLKPEAKSNYYVKLPNSDVRDSAYNLPATISDRPVITVKDAVANDTLNIVIKNKQPATLYVLVHNYQQQFFYFPVKVSSNARPVKIILVDLPRGLAEITIMDSLQRPCAERLFFAHYDRGDKLNIKTDKETYKTREKVALNLQLHNRDGQPVTGIVSIACVQANRLEIRKQNDISAYFYLEHELGRLPLKEKYLGSTRDDKAYLEDVLLIKGWRRYIWKELVNTMPADTVQQHDTLQFTGNVSYFGKPLKKPVNMVIRTDSALSTLVTEKNGSFSMRNNDMLVAETKKVYFYVAGKDPVGYDIKVNNPYEKIDSLEAMRFEPMNYDHFATSNFKDEGGLKGFEHIIQLREVKIKAGGDNSLFNRKPIENACGDYVCKFRILNCPNHRNDIGNTLPVEGSEYLQWDETMTFRTTVFYRGCVGDLYNHTKKIDGINYSVQFYPSDYQQFNPPEPEYLSTIYWKHLYRIAEKNNQPISFYTGDITGAFKIVVQGIGDGDVISGERVFMVTKP